MVKRKRDMLPAGNGQQHSKRSKGSDVQPGNVQVPVAPAPTTSSTTTVQIVAGSYDRILHGLTASIPEDAGSAVKFADTFLFDAHTSAIKCLAVSPPSAPVPGQAQKVMLATGGSDERINVYHISAHPPRLDADQELISALAPRPVLENPKNRELGTLLHHSSTITRLSFPTRSKLLSASEDSTIGVTRTRDWSLLSIIKAPIPKAQGRPSGDTAPIGGVPAGINDFAVHPSMKLMISVSRGERCMRLWNLVTGKKAGVLNFGKEFLQEIGEGKLSMGEGRRVVWGGNAGEDEDEDEFAVAFDREILVFGMDGTPKCRVMGSTKTKVHQLHYVRFGNSTNDVNSGPNYLAVSTEDGCICFFSTRSEDLSHPEKAGAAAEKRPVRLPKAKLVGTLGGKEAGITSRIKDFVPLPAHQGSRTIVSGSSDGKLALWKLSSSELSKEKAPGTTHQVGRLLGAYETQNRITCLAAFVMIPTPEGVDDGSSSAGDEEAGSDEEED